MCQRSEKWHMITCARESSPPDKCQKSISTDLQTLPFTTRAMSYTQKQHVPFVAPVSVMCLLLRLQYHGSIPQTLHLDGRSKATEPRIFIEQPQTPCAHYSP